MEIRTELHLFTVRTKAFRIQVAAANTGEAREVATQWVQEHHGQFKIKPFDWTVTKTRTRNDDAPLVTAVA